MTPQESTDARLARIEEHLVSIDEKLSRQVPLRHAKDGTCDAYHTVIAHDRRMNQWIGFVAAISLLFSIIGGAVVLLASWLHEWFVGGARP